MFLAGMFSFYPVLHTCQGVTPTGKVVKELWFVKLFFCLLLVLLIAYYLTREFCACSSIGRADVLYTSGSWFESRRAHHVKNLSENELKAKFKARSLQCPVI